MKNRIWILAVLLLTAFSGNSQLWHQELEKHSKKSVSEINKEMEKYFGKVGRTKANKYHKYLRWYDYASNHQNEEGYRFNHSVKNRGLLKQMNSQIAKYSNDNQITSRHYHGGWSSINPDDFLIKNNLNSPSVGRVNCLAKPNPTSDIIYAGTATGGVWKTYNHGSTWEPLWDGMVQTGVSSIVVDYEDPNHIIALTGDGDSFFMPSSGVYHSLDAGETWELAYQMDVDDQIFGTKLLQNKKFPQIFYISTRNNDFSNIIQFNILGPPSYLNGPSSSVFDMDYQTDEDEIIWAAASDGLYRKIGSDPWVEVNHPKLPTETVTRSAVAMAPSNKDIIYYAVAKLTNTETFYGIYKSINKGSTWEIIYDTTDVDIMTYQCGYNFTLDVDPVFQNRIYIGTGFFYGAVYDSGELEFEQIPDYIHADIHNSYHMGGNHYVCTDGGISVSTAGSPIYKGINNGLLCTQFYDLDVYDTTILGGTQDNGTKIWNIGDQVGYRPVASDGLDCMIDPTSPNLMFTSTQDSKQRSTNGMDSHTNILNANWHDPMEFAVDNPKKVLIHSVNRLRVSNDQGETFLAPIRVFDSVGVHSITQCKANPNVLYLAKSDSIARTGNFNSNPSSINWTRTAIPGGNVKNILVHPDSCDVVFQVKSGYFQDQILKSIDGGQTFDQPYSQGIKDLPVFCIYYDHVNGNGYYIGTELGVFYRNSTMEEWIPFSTYLPRVPVYDLKINNNYIYAATYGRGVWRSPRYRACSKDLLLLQVNDPMEDNHSGQQIHKASNIIVSDRIISGGSGTNVLYQAGNYIDLTDGFHAKRNNELFVAKAAGCLEE